MNKLDRSLDPGSKENTLDQENEDVGVDYPVYRDEVGV
jgi:hypothetical protein